MHDPDVAIHSRERLSLLEPSRRTTTPSPTELTQLAPLSFSHRRSRSSSTITARTHSGSWTDLTHTHPVNSIIETPEPPTPAPFTNTDLVSASDDASTSFSARPISDVSTSNSASDTPTSDASSLGVAGFEMLTHDHFTAPGRSPTTASLKTPPLPRRNPSRADRSRTRTRVLRRDSLAACRPCSSKSPTRTLTPTPAPALSPFTTPAPLPLVTRIRVKLHGPMDTRYLMIAPEMHVSEVLDVVAVKLGLSTKRPREWKLKMRDEEGDFVTVADEEDWELCLEGVRREARAEWEAAIVVREGEKALVKEGERAVVRDKGELLGKVDLWVVEGGPEAQVSFH